VSSPVKVAAVKIKNMSRSISIKGFLVGAGAGLLVGLPFVVGLGPGGKPVIEDFDIGIFLSEPSG
jgi:hypothetical protein